MIDPLAGIPKAELHVHLEGSIAPSTLLGLANKYGVDLPAGDVQGLQDWFRFRDFRHFVEIYLTCSSCLRDPEDFLLITQDFAREQVSQGVVYTEAHFTMGTHILNGRDPAAVLEALNEGVAYARDRGLELCFIFDIVRNVPRMADATLEWALTGAEQGIVVALGLSGFEDHPASPFEDHFIEAERRGLRRTAHAGEHGGPEVIEAALELARAERIGHGIRAIDSPMLVEQLVGSRTALEICPTSNVCLHAVESIEQHPFARLDSAGAVVTVNSDDPPLFNTTLTGEYELLRRDFAYSRDDLVRVARQAFDHSFAAPELRERMLADFDGATR